MTILQYYVEQIDRVVKAELDVVGLMPFWSSPAARANVPADALAKLDPLLAEPRTLAATPASSWPVELQYAWKLGLVYFRDAATKVDSDVAIGARRVILRDVRVDRFCVFVGDLVLVKTTYMGHHTVVEGPAVIVASRMRNHVSLGPLVVIEHSGFEPFSKVVRFSHVEKSLIASHCAIEGGTHPEQVPLGPQRRRLGCRIGPDAWVGQHVSVTGGGVVGRGSVVATHTSITRKYSDFVLISGTPPREYPIDFNIRGLSESEAFEEGRQQGTLAINLPVLGPHKAAFVSPELIEVDYAEHGCLRNLASINLLHFQCGVFVTALGAMLGVDVRAAFQIGTTIRFHLTLSPGAPANLMDAASTTPAMFRAGVDAGMVAEKADPAFLATTWKWFINATELPPFKAANPVVATADIPPDALVSKDTLSTVTHMVARLLNKKAPIDPDTPFHALGLDSIAAAELSVSVEMHFNISAPDVFRNNTVRKLALAIDRGNLS